MTTTKLEYRALALLSIVNTTKLESFAGACAGSIIAVVSTDNIARVIGLIALFAFGFCYWQYSTLAKSVARILDVGKYDFTSSYGEAS